MLIFEAPRLSFARRLLAACLDQDCALCGATSGALVCGDCASALPAPPQFDDATAAFSYAFPVDRLVLRFKYAGDLAIGHWLAGALAERVRREARPDLLVAPPSTRERLRRRGFNPALEIAKSVGRSLGVRCAIDGLDRIRETIPQPGLARRERERNLEGAFDCRLALDGLHVALVDDVMTTGATANAASNVLKQRGAARVSLWVVARTPGGRPFGDRTELHV